MESDEKIICPICGKEVLNLLGHIKIHNPKIRSKKVFFEFFPNYSGKFQIDCTKHHNDIKCPYCGKSFLKKNALQLHIKRIHPEFFKKEEIVKKCNNLICPICGKHVSDMKQHIKSHDIYDWEVFCKQYNWDAKLTKYISEEYRKKLSENKKSFYNSDKGLELRKEQSIKMQSELNPFCWASTKEKSVNTRAKNNTHCINGKYGLHVITPYGSYRSYNEFIFGTLCKFNNIQISYENSEYSVKWYNHEKQFVSTYTPDFFHEKIGLIELKGDKKDVKKSLSEDKYIQAQEIYQKLGIPFKILSLSEALKLFGLSYTFVEKIQIKKYILELVKTNEIIFVCPYKKSRILYEIFETDDFSKLPFIKTKE